MRKNRSGFYIAVLSLFGSLLLSACGWQLRGYEPASQKLAAGTKIAQLKVVSENRNNAFFRTFRNTLLNQQIELTDASSLRIEFSNEFLRRQPLTYNSLGVPAQYQLSLSVRFYVADGTELIIEEREIISRRNYDFDPNLIIAKDREEQELLNEMRRELSQRMLTTLHQSL